MVTNNIIMDIDELCIYLNMSKSTIYKLTQEGRIPCQKVGRRWRFHRDSIDKWLADQGPYHAENSDMTPMASSIENGDSARTTDASSESAHSTPSVNTEGLARTTGPMKLTGVARPTVPVKLAGMTKPAGSIKSSGTTKANSLKSAVSVLSEAPFVFFEKEQQEILKQSSISSIGALLVLLATEGGKNQLTELLMISRKELDQIALRITHYINNAQEK